MYCNAATYKKLDTLKAMLGEALGELEYARINQLLGHKALKILQRKASLAVQRAIDTSLPSTSNQVTFKFL